MSLSTRLAHAWNTFVSEETTTKPPIYQLGMPTTSSSRPDRPRLRIHSERTIISSIYTRLAIDVAGIRMEHCRLDENGQYVETIQSGLNDCLNVEANIDQGGRHFRQDMAMTLFTEGVIAIVPVDTTVDPLNSGSWDVKTMRVGTIQDWGPKMVRVRAYNENTGRQEDLTLPKSIVAIVENPFYSVMNEPNSTLQRLVHKLSMMDNIDEISSSGKLDLIIQLPYVTKTDTRKNQAELRRKELQDQLQGNTYGIAYAESSEKIIQLNRSVENNLLEQVKYLKDELFNELGLTAAIMNGTADDVAMLNYTNRTLEPVMDAITEAIARTFLTKTARTQGQSIMYFQTPFKLIPISQLGKLTDVLSRNQIITPNEIRPALGLKPSKEPQANKLVNSNMPIDKQITDGSAPPGPNAIDPTSPPAVAPPAVPAALPPGSADQAAADEAALNVKMAELGLT